MNLSKMKKSKLTKRFLPYLPSFLIGSFVRQKVRVREHQVNDITFKIASTRDELEQAYRLLQRVYVQEGYADNNDTELRFGVHNAAPQTTTFVGKQGDRVVITMTLFVDSILGLPMESLYEKELNKLRAQGHSLGEVGGLASDPDYRDRSQLLPFLITKIMFTYAEQYLGLDKLVVTVNPKHQLFYQKIIMFRRLGKNKDYGHVKGHPAVPLCLNVKKANKKYRKTYAKMPPEKNLHDFFFVRQSPSILLPKKKSPLAIWNADLFRYFFVEQTNLLASLDEKQRFLVESFYQTDKRPIILEPSTV